MSYAPQCVTSEASKAYSNEFLNIRRFLKLLKIIDIFKLQSLIFAHKFYKNLLPSAFDNYFTYISEIHSINTRLSWSGFALPKTRSGHLIRSPSYNSISFWNELNSDFYDHSLVKFKKNYTLHSYWFIPWFLILFHKLSVLF